MQIALTRVKSHQSITDTLDHNRSFIEHLMSNLHPRFSHIFLNCLSDPKGLLYAIPHVTYIILRINAIVDESNKHHNNTELTHDVLLKFVSLFIDTKMETLPPALYYIPKFNLYHHGNICHLNTCLLMLASLYHVLYEISIIPEATLNNELMVLNTILVSSYSPVDLYPGALLELIGILNININHIIPAEETMSQLVKIVNKQVGTDKLLHWDYAHSCLPNKEDTDLSLDDIVNKYHPMYLLVNGQDFSVDKNVERNDQFIPKYMTDRYTYKLASVIIHVGAHFMNVFMKGNEYIIKDDLYHRYKTPATDVSQLRYQITEVCYVRVDQ